MTFNIKNLFGINHKTKAHDIVLVPVDLADFESEAPEFFTQEELEDIESESLGGTYYITYAESIDDMEANRSGGCDSFNPHRALEKAVMYDMVMGNSMVGSSFGAFSRL